MDQQTDRRERPRLRIALVTETWRPEVNGVAMTLGRLVDGLRARDHRIEIVRPRQPGDRDAPSGDLLRDSLPIPRYSGLRLGLPAAHVLRARWRAERPDLVHVATEGPLGLSALRSARSLGIPLSSGFHTNFHQYSASYGIGAFHGAVARYLRWFHNRTRRTLVPTEAQRRELTRDGYRNVVAVGRGVDTALFAPVHRDEALRAAWGAGPRTLVALLVSRSAPEKNIPLAIRAWRALRARDPDTVLVIAGDGPERARLAVEHPDVRFVGNLPRGELSAHYASADVFLFPSATETFGNVVLEAMASGVAPVGFAYAAAAMHVHDGVSGALARFADPDDFVAAALRAAADRERLRAMGAAARTAACGASWDSIIAAFERVLAEAAAEGAPGAAP